MAIKVGYSIWISNTVLGAMPKKTNNILPKNITVVVSTNFLAAIAAQSTFAQVGEYCQFDREAIATKENLRAAVFQDTSKSANLDATKEYQAIVKEHRQALKNCRQKSWLKTQGIWLRLYPCDLLSGKLDEVMDRIVNKGYNQVFIEVLSDGKILLPQSENVTAWNSLVLSEKYKNGDREGARTRD